VRTARASLPSTAAAAWQGRCQVACVRGAATSLRQPRSSAGHAASGRSSRQPGSASQPTGVNATGAGATGGGAVWHAASNAPAAAISRERRRRTMEWIYLEALIALLLFVGIVWWTMGARRKPDAEAPRDDDAR